MGIFNWILDFSEILNNSVKDRMHHQTLQLPTFNYQGHILKWKELTKLQVFGKIVWVMGKLWAHFGKFVILLGKFSLLKIDKNEQTLWSHCVSFLMAKPSKDVFLLPHIP